ncbi:dihydrofolate reductase family protein [Kineococcus gynurae]|uniref:Dihydrofolate reductase family protein n=1 Tax=Kineococcus gynurae TaxID=452979 RepID=A0ABV5LR14_9ACTN
MTTVVYYTASTLNGFLATEEDSLDWLFAVPGADEAASGTSAGFAALMARTGVLVEGSTTYEWVLRHEDLLAQPHRWREFYGDRPTFVFTRRDLPRPAGADVRLVSGTVAEHWAEIEAAAVGRDVWVVGGGDLAGQFADAGRLDEIQVSVAPVTLTSGRPLLPRTITAERLHLREVRQAGQFAELVYDVRARPAEGRP